MNGGRQLGDLPLEIHRLIFSLLNFQDMDRMASVSKYWSKLPKDMTAKIRYNWLRDKIPRRSEARRELEFKIGKLKDKWNRADDDKVYHILIIASSVMTTIIIFIPLIWLIINGNSTAVMILLIISFICTLPIAVIFNVIVLIMRRNRIWNQMQICKVRAAQLIQSRNVLSEELQNFHQNEIEV